MADQRSRTWLWILIGGGAFFLFVLAVFSLVYLTLHAGNNEIAMDTLVICTERNMIDDA